MSLVRRLLCVVAIVLDAFLALTALAGGAALLTGIMAPPLSQLQGSIFHDYTIPGLALAVLVGGSALLAALLLIRRSRIAPLLSTAAGMVIIFFEFVEVLAFGSPAGIGRSLQSFYFGLGVLIVIVSMVIALVDTLAASRPPVQGRVS